MVKSEMLQIFVALGLTQLQAKVYFILLEEGETNVQTISRQTKLPQLNVNEALFELEKLGLVKEITPIHIIER